MAAPAEDEPDRKKAAQDLIEDSDGLAASASHVPDEETEALIVRQSSTSVINGRDVHCP
jgi:hypothetical protein